jgi:hypothetical protein
MGNFANDKEIIDYQERYCQYCIHGHDLDTGSDDCPVMELHSILTDEFYHCQYKEIFIGYGVYPETDWHNRQCAMFVSRDKDLINEISNLIGSINKNVECKESVLQKTSYNDAVYDVIDILEQWGK